MKRIDQNDDTFKKITTWVAEKCKERGFVGTFAMAQLDNDVIRWASSFVGVLKLNRPGKQDSNSLANCLQKLAMVIAHRRNTGRDTNIKGEVPWKGGRISEDGEVGYAFSGALQEEDDQLMREAEGYHKTLK